MIFKYVERMKAFPAGKAVCLKMGRGGKSHANGEGSTFATGVAPNLPEIRLCSVGSRATGSRTGALGSELVRVRRSGCSETMLSQG